MPSATEGKLAPAGDQRVTWAGGARLSPALPPAVTAALASGWAIHGELASQRYDTGAFERITAGA